MPRSLRRFAAAVATGTVAAVVSALAVASPATAVPPDLGQKVAIAAYIPPTDSTSWASLTGGDPRLGFIVANVANGPDTAVNAAWKSRIDAAHAAGTKVLGYVDSGYFGASTPVRQTLQGDTDATAWLVQAEQDIDRWYSFYGSSIDGIFIDDGMNVCGPGSTNTYADLYSQLNDYIHANHPGSLTVVNPGITVPECYEDTADVVVTFEGPASEYLNPPAGRAPAAWEYDANPDRIWNIVYDVSAAQLPSVMARSKSNNAGYIQATPDTLPNPYDTAPTGSYWTDELAATRATATTVPAAPAQPTVVSRYSTGVDLRWASSSSSSVVGYDVYRGAVKVGYVANSRPDPSEFTDVGLTPNTAYSYSVRARHRDGKVSAPSPARSVTTDVVWGQTPGAPGSPTASNLTANGVRVAWTASTVGNDPLAFYDVYLDGTRVVTVTPSVLGIHLGYLKPGTAYAITIRARTTSNATSPASATLAITTPDPTAVDSLSVVYGSSTATFQARFNLIYNFHHVFIDSDGSATTGYQIGGIGADWMLENGSFFQHLGTANTFDWSSVAAVPAPLVQSQAPSAGGVWTWQVPSSVFGSAASLQSVFNGSGSSVDYTSPVITTAKGA